MKLQDHTVSVEGIQVKIVVAYLVALTNLTTFEVMRISFGIRVLRISFGRESTRRAIGAEPRRKRNKDGVDPDSRELRQISGVLGRMIVSNRFIFVRTC